MPVPLVALLFALLFGAGCRSVPEKDSRFLRLEQYTGTIRVACVGDSITYGAGVENRESNNYPAILGKCLGARFEARNFGVNGATLLKKGDLPYWKLDAFRAVETFQPDVIILKLGTNDSKPQNWRFKSEFASDLAEMIDSFSRLPSKPRLWVCLPAPVYQDRWGINEKTVRDEIMPLIRQAAASRRVPVIDLHSALANRPDWFPDGVHPNAAGAANLAQVVCYALLKHP